MAARLTSGTFVPPGPPTTAGVGVLKLRRPMQTVGMIWTATAEVEKADEDRAAECVATHPGEPCPGWPHPDNEETL